MSAQPDLMTEIAEIVTDIRRLDYDNADPMRFSKRVARELADTILRDAARAARTALQLPRLIEKDHAEALEEARERKQ